MHLLRSYFFPIASEACHQQLIYSYNHPNYLSLLRVNSDHLLNLQLALSNPSLKIYRCPGSYHYEAGGLSSKLQDPYYYYYRYSLSLLGNYSHLRIVSKMATLVRQFLRRNVRLARITRSGRYKIFIISNRSSHLKLCLDSLLSTYNYLNDAQQELVDISVLFDDRASSPTATLSSYAENFKHYSFTTYSSTSLCNSVCGRSELRNYLVESSITPCEPSDTLIFIDGDVVLSEKLLPRLFKSAKRSPWGLFPVIYRSSSDSKPALDRQNLNYLKPLPFLPLIRLSALLFIKRIIVLIRKIIGTNANFLFSKYSPTLQSGVLFINYQVFQVVGGFIPIHDDPEAWGGEDAYLGQRLYKNNLLPRFLNLSCLAHHLFHDAVDQKERIYSKQVLEKLS